MHSHEGYGNPRCMAGLLHGTYIACNDCAAAWETTVDPAPPDAGDPAEGALTALLGELDTCIAQLEHARLRAERLLEHRRADRPWTEVVTQESRPRVVESISAVMASLATAGHAWRREQALALHQEDVSINRIAALFGVTRQRISALLRESGQADADDADDEDRHDERDQPAGA